MRPMLRIALVGDRNPDVTAHRAIPLALALASRHFAVPVEGEWLPTESLAETAGPAGVRLDGYAGVWCVPGSPYRSEAGALSAIRWARESGVPFLGTCGGCQHAILEYARNVLGHADAAHAEISPSALLPLIAPLSCALVEVAAAIKLAAGSRIRAIYGTDTIEEAYHCRYGLNPRLESLLEGSDMQITGRDGNGEARALELAGERFYVLTQFQPERGALSAKLPPVVRAFVDAAARLSAA